MEIVEENKLTVRKSFKEEVAAWTGTNKYLLGKIGEDKAL